MRYVYQASRMFGVESMEVRQMLVREAADELGHARFLADAIVDLGSEPTTTPASFPKPDGIREMLELDLERESGDVTDYLKHAEMAETLGHPEPRMRLEEMAADEAGHARGLRRLLHRTL